MNKLVMLIALATLALNFSLTEAFAKGSHYSGGHGSSHKGGHYSGHYSKHHH
jgi:hypothetical protein